MLLGAGVTELVSHCERHVMSFLISSWRDHVIYSQIRMVMHEACTRII